MTVVADDLDTADYYRLFAASDVCVGASRWEGLGLHLYEATAFAMPIIANDIPPMNELVRHGDNGLLVRSRIIGYTRSGLESYEPSVEDLTAAMEQVCDRRTRAALSSCAQRRSLELSWDRTVHGFGALLRG